MKRRQLLNGLAILILLVGMNGCDTQPPQLESLVIAEAHQAAFGLIYIAEHEGYFREAGLDVTLQQHSSGRDAIAAVVAGNADVGTPFETPVIINIQNQVPIRVLSSLALTKEYTQIVARKDSGIEKPEDLKGKRIGTSLNSSADYLLAVVLANAGIAPNQIERVILSPKEAVESVIQGRVDAIAAWSPHTQNAIRILGADAATVFTSPVYMEFITLSTVEQVINTRPEALKKLLTALLRAEAFTQNQPEHALQIIIETLSDQPAESVKQAWALIQPRVRLDNLLFATLSGELKWYAANTGQQQSTVDLTSYFATDLLRSVRPTAVTLSPEYITH
ncbi:hypothetical protein A1359_18185 [Methylomonas lenta]|uniref:Solute-binding protein family 3/N-terminal domain-containing protein n=1 Tax=Methylomonas lenta TaxID=980561 RepID=A0A177MW09_9GAMM|nr:NrtA/SsuA/CpmA family ABC transporter substrate-binding protein [Methylomonas lenta]OAI09906.1 hypothetical protein A1359_18185 [Methylomonas lenta]